MKVLLLAPVSVAAVLAQAAPAEPVGIIGLIVQLGLSGIFLWLYMTERSQRMKRDDQLLALTRELVPTLTDAVTVLNRVDASMNAQLRQSVVPAPGSLDEKLDKLLTQLGKGQ